MIIEISPTVTINMDQVSAVMRNPETGRAMVIVGTEKIDSEMPYEQLVNFMKNMVRMKSDQVF